MQINSTDLGARRRELRKKLQLSQTYVAKACGVSQGTVSNWEAGKPIEVSLVAYARVLKTTEAHLVGEVYESRHPDSEISEPQSLVAWDSTKEAHGDTRRMLPLFESLKAADAGISMMDDDATSIAFSKSALKNVGASADSYRLVFRGDSMEPKIVDGCTIGIDPKDIDVIDGKIYAIRQDDLYRVRVLHRVKAGYRIVSPNSEEFPEESDTIENVVVLGRVFWVSTMI